MEDYKQEKIWDPVTRLWHWGLVLSVTIGWSMGKFMSLSTIEWHFYLGYSTGCLLLFRYIWGSIGPEPIRFRNLISTPRETLDYLKNIAKRRPSGSAGHNPLGSLSVIAMILLLTLQVSTGLFVESEDFFDAGPLAEYASSEVIVKMSWLHRLCADAILIIIVLHISAILFYLLWKKENLIKPMFTGWKWVKQGNEQTSE